MPFVGIVVRRHSRIMQENTERLTLLHIAFPQPLHFCPFDAPPQQVLQPPFQCPDAAEVVRSQIKKVA